MLFMISWSNAFFFGFANFFAEYDGSLASFTAVNFGFGIVFWTVMSLMPFAAALVRWYFNE